MIDRDCIFCKIAGGDIPSSTVYEDEQFRVLLDLSPATKGHALILPKQHYANIFEIDENVLRDLIVLANVIEGDVPEEGVVRVVGRIQLARVIVVDSHLIREDDAVLVTPAVFVFRGQDVVAQVGHALECLTVGKALRSVRFKHILRLVLQTDQHGIGERVRTRHVLVQPFHREGLFGRLGHRAVLVNAVAEIVAIAVDSQGHGVAVGQAAVLVQGVVQALRLGGGGQAVDGGAAVGRDAAELHIHATGSWKLLPINACFTFTSSTARAASFWA